MEGYKPGTVVQVIDDPQDSDSQLVEVAVQGDDGVYLRWFHSSELLPRNADET